MIETLLLLLVKYVYSSDT